MSPVTRTMERKTTSPRPPNLSRMAPVLGFPVSVLEAVSLPWPLRHRRDGEMGEKRTQWKRHCRQTQPTFPYSPAHKAHSRKPLT